MQQIRSDEETASCPEGEEMFIFGWTIILTILSCFSQIINVDLVHVESRASEITKSDKGTQIILGQLIDVWVLIHVYKSINCRIEGKLLKMLVSTVDMLVNIVDGLCVQ